MNEAQLERSRRLYDEEIGTEDFVADIDEPAAARGLLRGTHVCPGGAITVYLRLEGPAQNRVREALVTGDFFVTPPRIIYDLESRLRGVFVDDLEDAVKDFLAGAGIEVLARTSLAARDACRSQHVLCHPLEDRERRR